MKTALLIVDVQNDFCPGGALATDRGDEVAAKIAELISTPDSRSREYSHILATQDWHIDPGSHFSDSPDFQDSWPVHCVADSHGAEIKGTIDTSLIDVFFRKGEYSAAYSGFEASAEGVGLADWLRRHDVDSLDVCGIATDHCVRATVLDAVREGFTVRVLRNMCSPVDDHNGVRALEEMAEAGAELT
ncbi:nicotinamidase [Corynebacterium auris]|uniref:nicotinamidase n=1 Tax=Corynebacterium auris TaxID=44750 RepID=UPI0025B3855B|nr:nicotinamidase [Corynebacterium auris]WJY68660.1 nicotinamidase/pyrazinamidase [Corynebacterium auris]